MNFTYIDISTIVLSTIFFYYLFNGYLSIKNIKNLLNSYPLIVAFFKLLGLVLLICLAIYFFTDIAYAMAPEPSADNNLPKPDVNVTTGDVNNSVTIKDSTINIPNVVAIGLTNLGTGAAVAAGITGASGIAAKAGVSPTAKLGIMAVGGVIGCVSVILANTTNIITQKKLDNAATSAVKSSTSPTTSTNVQASSNSGYGPAAFSIEPGADLDTVMSLLDANYILHICILYLPIALMTLYISTMIVENKWNLIFIKNFFGNWFYNFIIKSLSYTGKYNRIWMLIGWILLVFASLAALYVSGFLVNNIDIISEIVQQSKSK